VGPQPTPVRSHRSGSGDGPRRIAAGIGLRTKQERFPFYPLLGYPLQQRQCATNFEPVPEGRCGGASRSLASRVGPRSTRLTKATIGLDCQTFLGPFINDGSLAVRGPVEHEFVRPDFGAGRALGSWLAADDLACVIVGTPPAAWPAPVADSAATNSSYDVAIRKDACAKSRDLNGMGYCAHQNRQILQHLHRAIGSAPSAAPSRWSPTLSPNHRGVRRRRDSEVMQIFPTPSVPNVLLSKAAGAR
jgi:hypothetical protein